MPYNVYDYRFWMGLSAGLAALLLFFHFNPARGDLRAGWELVKNNRGLVAGLTALSIAIHALLPGSLPGDVNLFRPSLLGGLPLIAVILFTNFRGATRHLFTLFRKQWGIVGTLVPLLVLVGAPAYFLSFGVLAFPALLEFYLFLIAPLLIFATVAGAGASLYITFRFLEVPQPLFWEQYSRRFIPYCKWSLLVFIATFGLNKLPLSGAQTLPVTKFLYPFLTAFIPLILASRGGGVIGAVGENLQLLRRHFVRFFGYFVTVILFAYALQMSTGWAETVASAPILSTYLIPLTRAALGSLLGFWFLASLVVLYKRITNLDSPPLPGGENTFNESATR